MRVATDRIQVVAVRVPLPVRGVVVCMGDEIDVYENLALDSPSSFSV